MTKHARILAVLGCVALTSLGQTLAARDASESDRKALVEHLERTRAAFLGSIDGLSEEQWAWKPAPDRWSVAEVAEHITAAETMLRGLVTDQVLKAPASAELLAKTQGHDQVVLQRIPDRSAPVQAPESLQPKGTRKDRADLTGAFTTARATTIALAGDTSKDLRAHAMESPLGALDGYQWMLFISAHTERHTKQIEEVKAAPVFPGT